MRTYSISGGLLGLAFAHLIESKKYLLIAASDHGMRIAFYTLTFCRHGRRIQIRRIIHSFKGCGRSEWRWPIYARTYSAVIKKQYWGKHNEV